MAALTAEGCEALTESFLTQIRPTPIASEPAIDLENRFPEHLALAEFGLEVIEISRTGAAGIDDALFVTVAGPGWHR